MTFTSEHFQKRKFTKEQINAYFKNAERDLKIAGSNNTSEVIFTFTYQAFLKLGITLIAYKGYKIKSKQGYHVRTIQEFSDILSDESVGIYGEAMRRKRNIDLYAGGTLVTNKEAREYFKFTKSILEKVKQITS